MKSVSNDDMPFDLSVSNITSGFYPRIPILRSFVVQFQAEEPKIVSQSCPRVGWTRGSGRVTILPDFGGSGQHFGFFSFLLVISWYLNRYEFSNITFGLINFLLYLIYNN